VGGIDATPDTTRYPLPAEKAPACNRELVLHRIVLSEPVPSPGGGHDNVIWHRRCSP
jgi:hypothetical protein